MSPKSEDDLRAIWRNQPTQTVQITPEQLRTRAERFSSKIRRRYLRDQSSTGLLAIGCAFIVVALRPGALTSLGCLLLLIWALYVMWGLHRFGSAIQIPADAAAASCAAAHLRQLRRQRDMVLSWPLGFGLATPGFALAALGFSLGPKHLPWAVAVALIGVFVFVCLGTILYGKILASGWQAEIEEIEALTISRDSGGVSAPR